MPQTQW